MTRKRQLKKTFASLPKKKKSDRAGEGNENEIITVSPAENTDVTAAVREELSTFIYIYIFRYFIISLSKTNGLARVKKQQQFYYNI